MQAVNTPILTALNCASIWRRTGHILSKPPKGDKPASSQQAVQHALDVIAKRRKLVETNIFAVYAFSQGLQVVRLKLNSIEDNQIKIFEHGFLQAFCLTILLQRFDTQERNL